MQLDTSDLMEGRIGCKEALIKLDQRLDELDEKINRVERNLERDKKDQWRLISELRGRLEDAGI